MIRLSNCFNRKCIYLNSPINTKKEKLKNTTSDSVKWACKAFPKGIPNQIAYGENKHLKPLINQDNDIVFEKDD